MFCWAALMVSVGVGALVWLNEDLLGWSYLGME